MRVAARRPGSVNKCEPSDLFGVQGGRKPVAAGSREMPDHNVWCHSGGCERKFRCAFTRAVETSQVSELRKAISIDLPPSRAYATPLNLLKYLLCLGVATRGSAGCCFS
jgi:hypothetical protein